MLVSFSSSSSYPLAAAEKLHDFRSLREAVLSGSERKRHVTSPAQHTPQAFKNLPGPSLSHVIANITPLAEEQCSLLRSDLMGCEAERGEGGKGDYLCQSSPIFGLISIVGWLV